MEYFVKNKGIALAVIIIATSIYCFQSITINVHTKANNSDFSNFKDLNMNKANIGLKYEGKDLSLKLPIYVQNNRYYIPINEIINKVDGDVKIVDNNLYVSSDKSDIIVNINDSSFNKDRKISKLSKKIIRTDNIVYMSLFDFAKMLDLKTYWNYSNNTISFYKNRDKIIVEKAEGNSLPALIRLEDISAGGNYASAENLEKLRIVSDYLYKENIPFHVAWIPRYINPSLKIDNDPTEKYSMYNLDFIFTMDYLIDKNAVIGLHGYTHQYGNSESVGGIEFHRSKSDSVPSDKEYAEDRINKALEAAKRVDISCDFFEAPHYAILPNQLDVVEKNFDYIYEPYSTNGGFTESKSLVKKINSGRNVFYIPTPLDYIEGKVDCGNMLKRIENIDKQTLASFFYHPYIEFEDIKAYRDGTGYPCYEYSTNSVLHQVVDKLKSKKYSFVKIQEVVK